MKKEGEKKGELSRQVATSKDRTKYEVDRSIKTNCMR